MSKQKLPEVPGQWESRAFFAALLAACKGEDTKAAEILRQIASTMTDEFLQKGVKSDQARGT